MTTEQEEMWEKLSTLPDPPQLIVGFFYCPYIPLIKNNVIIVSTDV